MQNDHIHFRRIRPRIRVESELSSEEITTTIREKLESDICNCKGQVTSHFATIYPPDVEQHYWSPQLTITIEESNGKSLVRGLYGPKPAVWTMFVFIYSFIGFLTLIATMVWLSYRTMGEETWIFWLIPGFITLFLSLYMVAYFGQRLGQKQMTRIHRFIEDCIGQEIEPT